MNKLINSFKINYFFKFKINKLDDEESIDFQLDKEK